MRYFFIFLVFSKAVFADCSQVVDQPVLRQKLKGQAEKMGQALVNDDYKSFVNYTYPKLVQMVGGTDKMISVLNKTINDMKTEGMIFNSTSFDEPSKIIKSGKELQATIAQHTEIKLTHGRIVSTSTLIAISTNNGINWTFIDTSKKDLATLRKTMPNLSNAITIPPQQPPVHYNQ